MRRAVETTLAVALAQVLIGNEHALVCQAAVHYEAGCTEAELLHTTSLTLDRLRFILWDLHQNGLGKYESPVFCITPESVLQEAVEGIPGAEERRRFNCALKGPAVGVADKGVTPDPMEE